MAYSAVQQYKEQAIQSMTGGELLILLYDEVIKNLNFAKLMLEQKNYATFEKCTEKSKNIIRYLINILDRRIEISKNLYQMYFFFNQEIIRAEIKREAGIIEPLIPLVEDLRQTWVEANRLVQIQKS